MANEFSSTMAGGRVVIGLSFNEWLDNEIHGDGSGEFGRLPSFDATKERESARRTCRKREGDNDL